MNSVCLVCQALFCLKTFFVFWWQLNLKMFKIMWNVKYDIFIAFCFQNCWTVEMNISIPMRKQQGRSVKQNRLNIKTWANIIINKDSTAVTDASPKWWRTDVWKWEGCAAGMIVNVCQFFLHQTFWWGKRAYSPCTFYSEGDDALEQVARGGCGCPIPGSIQGQAGYGYGQPGLVVGNPAHSRWSWN